MRFLDKLNSKRLKFLVIILITLIAAFFRLYQITQLPPGNGYDPAFYGVDALQILRGSRPIFLSTNYGREALFSYLVAVCVVIWGPTALAVNMASVIVGILTIPAVYLLSEEILAEESPPVQLWGSSVAALMMAVSYWHVNWSRYGVRAILVPLFAAWTITYLCRGLRRLSTLDFIVCGIMLGLSLYTYPAARLLPLLVVAGFTFRVLQQRAFLKRDVTALSLIVIISFLVFAPMGYFFLKYPQAFMNRLQQVFIFDLTRSAEENLQAFAEQLLHVLAIFGFKGDIEPYCTIPGRPALNVFFAGWFYIGLVSCLVQKNKPRYKLVFTWWLLLLIPATISTYAPATKRAIGTLPAVALLIAIGAVYLWHILESWASKTPSFLGKIMRFVYIALLISGFIYSGILTYRDYFVIWAANPDLFTHFEVGVSMIGEYIRTLAPEEQVYVSPDLPNHPGIRFHSNLRENVYGYNGRVCLVMPEKTATGTSYIIAPSKDKLGLEQLQVHYPQGQIVYDGPLHYGEPYFRVYQAPQHSTAYITPTNPVEIGWSSYIQMLGYDIGTNKFHPGDTIILNLYYKKNKPMPRDYTAFVHLLGTYNPVTGNPLWAQNDSEPCHASYPTSSWKAGEIIKDKITIQLPLDIPPGTYTLATGFYDLSTMERVTVLQGEAQDNVAILGTILVE